MNKFLLIFLLFLPAFVLFAEEEKFVTVNIKSIECTGKKEGKGKQAIKVEDSIGDLRNKLKNVPYKEFKLASSKTVKIPAKKQQSLSLQDGDQLGLELLYLDQERVGLWIDWKDQKGMQLLDTRMHFDCQETMLAGADSEGDQDSAKILAIEVADKE